MRVVKSPDKLTSLLLDLKLENKTVGFVPTMGFLHEGHLSLVRRARRENKVVVVSIFVNPTQFGPKEDFKQYPKNMKRDLKMLSKEKVDFVLIPSVHEIYPENFITFLDPGPLADVLCGLKRLGHFRGVVTVVKRLFDIAIPDVAYFGQKDYQQARIIQEMVERFHLPVRVRICPIVREKDGLAMSSRNIYLSGEERIRATFISKALELAKRLVLEKNLPSRKIEKQVAHFLKPYVDKIDYTRVVSSETLKPVKDFKEKALVAIACFIGKARLIDNILVQR